MHKHLTHLVVSIGTVLTVVLTVVGAALWSAQPAHASAHRAFALTTQMVPMLKQAQMIEAMDQDQQLNLSVALRLQNEQALQTFLANLYNPQSPAYHHFLTPQQFTRQFAPTIEQQNEVIEYLQDHGVIVTSVSPNGLLINGHTTVDQAQDLFQVQLNHYQLDDTDFYANASAPILPDPIAPFILSINGLDDSVRWHPQSHFSQKADPVTGYSPSDIQQVYDIKPFYQQSVQGEQQTIAMFELDGYNESDINEFFAKYHLPHPKITNVLVDGASGATGRTSGEVEMDIEIAGAIAPGAEQIIYEGPNAGTGVNDTYSRIVNDNKAQIISVSWGTCEQQAGLAEVQTLDAIFQQASAQGMSIFAASGDAGAYDCGNFNLGVDSPASDPYVTGVGGTTLTASNGVYGSEKAWSNPEDIHFAPKGSGSGGGLSSVFPRPSWQTGPGVQNVYSTGSRQIPDVAANADNRSGYIIYCTVAAANCAGTMLAGGTSAAAPLWAGCAALLNQYLQKEGKARVGFINPCLYKIAASPQRLTPFHDITTGDNLYYPAAANYDLVTGLGSPDVFNIARVLAWTS